MTYKVKSPILFLIFNRPYETKIVFDAIRNVKPGKLYIASDGPRLTNPSDRVLVKKAREIINFVDWECEVRTKFNEHNKGCKISVSESISWFFENESEGIILEDDCLPLQSFFRFCDEMLDYYRLDNKISHISGSTFQKIKQKDEFSYYFSKLTHVWGWAAWKRSWNDYDVNLKNLKSIITEINLSELTSSNRARVNYINQLKKIHLNQLDTWDYQYSSLNFRRGSISIIPKSNLIMNIGIGKNATHTFSHSPHISQSDNSEIEFPLMHPCEISINRRADEFTMLKETPGSVKVYWTAFKLDVKLFLRKLF